MILEQLREFDEQGVAVILGLTRAVEPLAPDQYRITVSPDNAVPNGVTVELTATDSSRECASVKMHVAKRASVIWITVGLGLDLEIPVPITDAWQPLGLASVEDTIEELARAAILGKVREKATLVDEEVVESQGTITIGTRPYPIETFHGRPRERTVEVDYRPYAS